MSANAEDAAEQYRVFCELNVLITGNLVEAAEGRELLASSVALSRLRALYPLDGAALHESLVKKLQDQQTLERFVLACMNAFNLSELDSMLYVAYDEAAQWSESLADAVAGNLISFSDDFFEVKVPEGWAKGNPPYFHFYDIALTIYTLLRMFENWEAWVVEFEIEQRKRDEEEAQYMGKEEIADSTLDHIKSLVSRWQQNMRPVLAALS